jgi:putative transposase
MHTKITGGNIPTIQEVKLLVDSWLEFKHSQPCPNVKDKTIKEVFESREKSNIDINMLDDLMMAQEIKTIYRNGIRFLNTFYFSDALYGLKERVIIKYSLFDLTYVRVYSTKGEYLCTAKRVEATHPMAYHLGDVKDMQDFKQKIKKQKQLRNRTLNTIKKYIPKEDIKFIETQMIEENTAPAEMISEQISVVHEIEQSETLSFNGRPVFMNNYERYEWLMKNGCTNPEDRKWLAAYKNCDEYQLIYGDT